MVHIDSIVALRTVVVVVGDLLFVIELNVSNGESQREKLVSRKVVAVVFGLVLGIRRVCLPIYSVIVLTLLDRVFFTKNISTYSP